MTNISTNNLPQYCAVIRTLGRAGSKYQTLLDSLKSQTHPPKRIIVYLAEGYDLPKETIDIEEIVSTPKGMVAQRALPYNEVDTEWMLMLDDDISIASDGVERMFREMLLLNADVCAVDAYDHSLIHFPQKMAMAILLSSFPRFFNSKKGYSVTCTGGDMYNPSPRKDFAWSTTNSGMAFFCRKKDFLSIRYHEELWLDQSPYAIPDDKVMFYKMHLHGLKILTHYHSGFTHLDAGTSVTGERAAKIAYSMARNNKIFYDLYVWPNLPAWKKPIARILNLYRKIVGSIYGYVKGNANKAEIEKGYRDAIEFIRQRNGEQ